MILGIDPGNEQTAFAATAAGEVYAADKVSNEEFLNASLPSLLPNLRAVAVESIQSYGMAVGQSVFETCYMIGRIQWACELAGVPCHLYPRPEYARAICGVGKISDAVVRQALLLRFGGDKKGEPLNMLKGNSDKRSAFAVAIYHLDREALAA